MWIGGAAPALQLDPDQVCEAGAMMGPSATARGLGLSAGIDEGTARDLAERCQQLGYHSPWTNDEPAAPGLETLAHFHAAAPQLCLGFGVLPWRPRPGDGSHPSTAGYERLTESIFAPWWSWLTH